MKNSGPLHISDVTHKTKLNVDESGTEAAFVTMTGLALESIDLEEVFRHAQERSDAAAQSCRDGLAKGMKPMKPLTFRRGFLQIR